MFVNVSSGNVQHLIDYRVLYSPTLVAIHADGDGTQANRTYGTLNDIWGFNGDFLYPFIKRMAVP